MKYLSIKDFAEQSGLTQYFVRKLIADGKLPYITSGVKIFIDAERAEKALEELQNGGKQ